uniref:KIB1-4 beta-propeller domain-containing protein n=1 Tax=Oryza punctata TaxID=4537 RepID=A0A0E0KMQ0_ORYPU
MAAPAERRSEPDWSLGLPRKLLEFIAKKLPSGQDAASFRLVCTPWCAALPLETFYPMLMLPFDPESPDDNVVTFYCAMDDDDEATIDLRLPEVRGKVACGSSHGWLALMDEAAAVTLLNPFTGGNVTLPAADRNVALASYKTVSMVDGAWILHYISGATKPIRLSNMRDVFFREIVLSASPRNSSGVNCMAMAVLASSTLIAFCRLGDTRWTMIDSKLEYPVTCVVHCRDRFVAIGSLGEISIFSANNTDGAAPLTASPLLLMPPPAHICQRSYMDMNGDLYLIGAILRVTGWTRYEIVVYKCDLLHENPCWSKVEDSEDIAFFVSKNFNTGFTIASTSNIRWNCVYLSEPGCVLIKIKKVQPTIIWRWLILPLMKQNCKLTAPVFRV